MIKKALTTLIFVCTTGWAQTVVPIVWPFNPGSTQSNYVRSIIEDANSQQQKYSFVFESKPGAGGSIAMNYVLNNNRLTVVSNSPSFFTRPMFFPNESYDISRFAPVAIQATGQPLAIISKKFSTFNELKTKSRLTIGMNNGSITQLVAETLAKQLPNVELVLVAYPGTPEATRDVIAGHIDLSVDLANDTRTWVNDKKLNVIGITGTKSYPNFPSFHSMHINAFDDIVVNYILLVSADVPETTRNELHAIFRKANQSPKVLELYTRDLALPADQNLAQSERLFQSFYIHWRKLIVK